MTESFEKFSAVVKKLGIRFYGKHAEEGETPWEAIEAYLLEHCQKLAAFALFHVRSTDLEWYRVVRSGHIGNTLVQAHG